ncbi:MAG TPA: hypothetical protein PKE05_02130 [Microthrixaceae bacterium]|mgnify:CR=1 FL=1|nr:hypothetical protein [Microthrixaceae bacterium]
MITSAHLVLSCTNRKHAPPGVYPRLRDVGGRDVETRAAAWIETVAAAEPRMPARELYAGEYWTTALALADECRRHMTTEVWVISAGLGLVRIDDRVPAYAATLATGHPDSVARGSEGRGARETWWHRISTWDGPSSASGPRRLADLDVSGGSTVIVCAGRTYVDAVAADLAALRARISGDRLLLLSSGEAPANLEDPWLSVPGQLRMRFGGSMSSTSTRACREAVRRLAPAGDLRALAVRGLLNEWVQDSAQLPLYDRKRLSDDDIKRWIERDVVSNSGAANKTASLRRLRESGAACEQARFGRLFEFVMEASE